MLDNASAPDFKNPNTKSPPELAKCRIFSMHFATALMIFCPNGTVKIKTARANCRASPDKTVFRLIAFFVVGH